MKLFYTVGGGLGHLTRFTAVLKTLRIDEPVTVIASSPFARDTRVVDPRHNVLIPPFKAAKSRESLIEWLQEIIDELKPEEVYIDAFPAGILGELCDIVFPPHTKMYLLARIIKWPVYLERIPFFHLKFKEVYRLEQLDEKYDDFLRQNSDSIIEFSLTKPESDAKLDEILPGCWLVIHSGPDSELEALLKSVNEDLEQLAQKPQVAVVFPGRRPNFVPEHYSFVSAYPVFSAYERAARVYSAAGFNMVEQMKPYRSRHYVMPFERILDDQFARCRLHEKEFAAVLGI